MKILLLNRNEQYIATLKDVLSAKHTEELNGENVLEIETLDEIEKNQRLIYKDRYGYWHEFIVRGVEEERAEAGIIRRVFAEHSFYETWGDYIEDKRPYDVPANIALESALESTRWEVGIVDDLGINSTNFYHISAKEAVQKVAETWQDELRYRIEVSGNRVINRYVDLLARRGQDLGKRFTYTKDLMSITKTVHRDDVITALYGYGKGEEIVDEEGQPTGGYGRRITFGEINGGKNYVENLDAKEIWGRLNPDGTRSHVFGKAEFDDIEDPYELLQLTQEKLEELSQPLVTYEAKVIDLKALRIEHEGVELGDWVGIVDKEFNPPLRLKARVIKIVRDLLEPENTEIILGNFIPTIADSWLEQEKYISNFRDKQGVWDRSNIINDDGTINAQFLNNLVAELNAKMNAQGGYVFLSEDGKGLITTDNPTIEESTMAIQLLGGSFRIANSKLPDGTFDWRTFGTGKGFTGDLITAGKVKAQFLQIGSQTEFEEEYDPSQKETPAGAQAKADQAEQNAKNYADSQLFDFAATVISRMDNLQDQIDGAITTWFYPHVPTNDNLPASEWVTDDERNKHLGDLFYDTNTGYAYRYMLENGIYKWQRITDSDVTKALADAARAQDTADSKRRVFTTQPTPPYDVGDLWAQGENGELMRCKVARQVGNFVASDWEKATKYTDDTRAVQAENNTKAYADSILEQLADGNYQGGTFINGKSVISPVIAGNEGRFTGTVKIGTGNDQVGISGEGGDASSIRIWAGNNNKAQAPFRVTQDGSLIATKADINGALRAGGANRIEIVNGVIAFIEDDTIKHELPYYRYIPIYYIGNYLNYDDASPATDTLKVDPDWQAGARHFPKIYTAFFDLPCPSIAPHGYAVVNNVEIPEWDGADLRHISGITVNSLMHEVLISVVSWVPDHSGSIRYLNFRIRNLTSEERPARTYRASVVLYTTI